MRGLSAGIAKFSRRVVSGASRYRNYPKLRDRLQQTTKQAERAQRRVGRLVERAADLRIANAEAQARIEANRRLYIDLLKRAVMHTLYRPLDIGARTEEVQRDLDEEQTRALGRDWPVYAQTMVGLQRLDNVQYCVETVLRDGVPGDFIETGIWRGGTVIFMRGVLKAYGDPPNRVVFAADSFQGLPPVNAAEYPADKSMERSAEEEAAKRAGLGILAVPQRKVQRNFELYGLYDDRVQFLPGWFKDTLPAVRERTWSVIRLDGDYYESTMDALVNLYPKLSVGGFLIVDDFAIPACREAVEDYRKEHGIDEPIKTIDWTAVYWRRER